MKILILGSGLMGPAAAHYLLSCSGIKHLTLVDQYDSQLQKAEKLLSPLRESRKLELVRLDLGRQDLLRGFMKNYEVIAAALPWPATRIAIKAALQALKPLVSITRPAYLQLDEIKLLTHEKSPLILLGCGLEPGLSEIAATQALNYFSSIDELHIRCGGLPQRPEPPLYYKSVFNANSLPIEPRQAYLIEEGELKAVPRFSGLESVYIEKVGLLEAWHDGMLPWLIDQPALKQAKKVTQKTLRWPGFAEVMHFLERLGFLSKIPLSIGELKLMPKEITELLLRPHTEFRNGDQDLSILQIEASGRSAQGQGSYQARLIDYYDEKSGLSAMARTTGYTLGIATALIASGEISGKGLVRPEELFRGENYQKLLHALNKLGIYFNVKFKKEGIIN